MYCYEIWVRSNKYHNHSPLTYTSTDKLESGMVVKVDLRNSEVLGVIRRLAVAPRGIAMKPILKVLSDSSNQIIPKEILLLLNWFLQYYPASSGVLCQLILPSHWQNISEINTSLATSSTKFKPNKLPKLTKDQSKAQSILNNNHGSFLLHGETGSGKTRIYLGQAIKNLAEGKSVIILVPEIGLVSHIYSQISDYIDPVNIKVFHSNLTPKQHRQTWYEVLTSLTPLVVIGPRSALFLPLKNIGLIVVDECHDDGYNQTNSPIYNGLRVASKLAQIHNSNLIFGSATPSITDFYIAKSKHIPIIRMSEIANKDNSAEVKKIIVNKLDKTEFTTSKILSSSLINLINLNLKNNNQILLFLNRRGSSKLVACINCGWRAVCQNCDLNLTFHKDKFKLVCHTCGFNADVPAFCPDCKNPDIIFSGPGTKSVETEINKLFPHASTNRFDSDNLTADRLETKLKAIINGKIDIIIGTQILVKGFDIPNLGLVGILDADTGMILPDFATEERTYQLLSQAIGRVGRGHLPGTVVIQSMSPDSILLTQSITKNWDNFYNSQLGLRKQHYFPPYTFLLKLECSRKQRKSVISATENLKATLINKYPSITILGPAPSFHERHKSTYTWQLVIKSPRRSVLLNIIKNLPSGWRYFLDPSHLL